MGCCLFSGSWFINRTAEAEPCRCDMQEQVEHIGTPKCFSESLQVAMNRSGLRCRIGETSCNVNESFVTKLDERKSLPQAMITGMGLRSLLKNSTTLRRALLWEKKLGSGSLASSDFRKPPLGAQVPGARHPGVCQQAPGRPGRGLGHATYCSIRES